MSTDTSSTQPPAPTRKGPKPRFDQNRVLDAALDLIDAEGLAALNVRRLTTELKVSPMTLYGYLENKDTLLDLMTMRALEPAIVPTDPAAPWEQQIIDAITALHSAFLTHPGVVELLIARSISHPGLDQIREQLLAILIDAGFSEEVTIQAITALVGHALGSVIVESFHAAGNHEAEADRLHRLPAGEYPHLTALAHRWSARGSSHAFTFGLDHMIGGLRASR